SKISLSQYLERKRPDRKALLDLLGSITRNLLLHSNYLLELSSFVMNSDFIFINPATAEASLVYVPVSCGRNSSEVCRSFFKELVVNSANADDNAKDNYMQRILGYLKSEPFSLNDFSRLLSDLKYNGEQSEAAVVKVNEAAAAGCMLPEIRSSGKSRGILAVFFIQLLVILPAVIICLFLVSKGMADPASAAGVLVIGAAVDILVMKRRCIRPAVGRTKHAEAKRLEAPEKIVPPEAPADPETVRACDTVMILEAPGSDYPYLERAGEHNGERIIIGKDRFTIGRLGSMVDHVIPDGTIGKLHAEIISREGSYYLTDLNSKNGTYINGERIASNMEYEITGSCRIRFSNYEYLFRQ
ncbi:MAG TPA: FHA domain-containing protein, partial [Clostridia bacterium]|nr:FHA domain-containing protein [Clostridia bacterium]